MSAIAQGIELAKGTNLSYDASLNVKKRVEKLKSNLEQERASFLPIWKDVADYILPSRGMAWLREGAGRRSDRILDNTGTLDSDILVSGLLSGMAGPTINWFNLEHPDFKANEIHEVQKWTHVATEITHSNLLKTDAYNNFNLVFKDCSGFGTAAFLMERDFENYLRTEVFEVGSYLISQNYKKVVDTFIREARMTVRQIVEKFCKHPITGDVDLSNVSNQVASHWKNGNHEEFTNIVHAIYPNENYNALKSHSFYNKKYSAVYYEGGNGNGLVGHTSVSGSNSSGGSYNRKILYIGGHNFFPVLCPRWQRNSTDTYGVDCPAWQSLGDIMELQALRQDKMDNLSQLARPAMIGPTDLQTAGPSIIPNSITYSDEREDQKGFRPIINTRLDYLAALTQDEQFIRVRIDNAWYKKVFLAVIDKMSEMTKYETMERVQEKKQILGPMNVQFIRDFLEPFINNSFEIFAERGLYPEAPSEIAGQDLKIEYISDIAKAQRTAGVRDIEDFAMFGMQLAQNNPQINDVINFDEAVREIVQKRGMIPSLVRPENIVQQMRMQRQQQEQQIMAAQQMKERAAGVKNLSQADTSGKNALTQMMGATA